MRHRWLFPLVITIVVVAGLSTFMIRRAVADGPADVVRAYLEAARGGDVRAAMRAGGVDEPPSGSVTTLAAVPWRVEAVGTPFNQFRGEAEVEVRITDGSKFGTGYFQLRDTDGRWRIVNPYAAVKIFASPVRVPPSSLGEQQVLPGVYVAGGVAPDLVQGLAGLRVVALPTYSAPAAMSQEFTPTAAARGRFQQMSDAYLDKCLTDRVCAPRGFSGVYETPDGGIAFDREVRRSTWRVLRYPKVDLPGVVMAVQEDTLVFHGQVVVPGVLQVEGETTGKEKFSSTCLLDGNDFLFNAWVEAGVLHAGWLPGRETRIEVDCRYWAE